MYVLRDTLLYIVLNAGYDLVPRALYKINLRREKVMWKVPFAGPTMSLKSIDIDKDGRFEYIVTTGGVSNGRICGDMKDSEGYVLVVGEDGNIVWKRKCAEYFSSLWADCGDVDGDGEFEVVVSVYGGPEEDREGHKIFVFSHDGGLEKKISSDVPWNEIKCVDLDGDGVDEVVCSDNKGRIVLFYNGMEKKLTRRWRSRLRLGAVEDLTGDGRPELVFRAYDGNCLVFDRKLRLLLCYYVGQRWGVWRCGRTRGTKVIAIKVYDGDKEKSIVVGRLKRVFPGTYVAGGALGVLFIALVVFMILHYRFFVRAFYALPLSMCTVRGGRICDAKGLLERYEGRELKNLLRGKSLDGRRLKFQKRGVVEIDGVLYNYELFRVGLSRLMIITDVPSEILVSWSGMIQELLHSLRNPLTTILLNLERLKKETGDNRKIERCLEETERLRAITSSLMRFTSLKESEKESVSVGKLLDEILGSLPAGVEVRKRYSADPVIWGDRLRLKEAFRNIVTNAVEAMGDGGVIFVDVEEEVLIGRGKRVEVEITDTGKGIPEEYIDKLFNPFFTLKSKGAGLGLFIAKKIIEEHKGRVEIFSGEDGTTVRVSFLV